MLLWNLSIFGRNYAVLMLLVLQSTITACLDTKNGLGKGNLTFCSMDSRDNYFRLADQQNNDNNPQFKGQQN